MPDRGCIESCKPGAQSARGPVEDWHSDDVWQAIKSAEQEAALGVEFLVANDGRDGAGRRGGWCAVGWVVSHHVGELSAEG